MRATMKYRTLGKTGLEVSEIGFGGEWLERHGLFKDILVLHGRMDSITGQERWSMYVRHSKIC